LATSAYKVSQHDFVNGPCESRDRVFFVEQPTSPTIGQAAANPEGSGQRQRQRQLPPHLKVFRESLRAEQEDANQEDAIAVALRNNVHLNPATHWAVMNAEAEAGDEASEISHSLSVCVLGVPNAGKSSLVNALSRVNACPVSPKTHTTRRNRQAILTDGHTQLVVADTPGLVKDADAKRFHLEKDLVHHPERGLAMADLIVVAQDVSNRFVREAIDKRVLKLLCRYANTPSVLVLTKMDELPESRPVLDLVRKLTCNHLDGVDTTARPLLKKPRRKKELTTEHYLKRLEGRESDGVRQPDRLLEDGSSARSSKATVRSGETVADFLLDVRANAKEWTDDELTARLRRVVGWPGFREVFAVSVVDDTGIAMLRSYLMASAKPVDFNRDDNGQRTKRVFSPRLLTTADPQDVVLSTIKAKAFEVFPHEIPYEVQPELSTWSLSDGALRVGVCIRSKRPRFTSFMLAHKVSWDSFEVFACLAIDRCDSFVAG
jgi:small GTP-binding protein